MAYPGGGAARTIEQLYALSMTADAGIATPTAADGTKAFRMAKLNPDLADYQLTLEDDAAEVGKGDEFATQVFPVSNHLTARIDKYLSSEIFGYAITFGLGASTATVVGGGTKHLAVPFNPTVGGLELPYGSLAEQVRPGLTSVIDRLFAGVAVDGFQIDFTSSPARDSAKISIDLVGTGQVTTPSLFTMPAVTPAHELKASSLVLAGAMFQVSTVDYITAKTFVSASVSWKNNLTARYAPGGGTQSGGALATALEVGTRAATMSCTVRVVNGSDEFTKIVGGVTGPANLTFTGPSFHAGNITFPKIGWKVVKYNNTNGIITFDLEASIINAGTGVLSMYAINALAKMGSEV